MSNNALFKLTVAELAEKIRSGELTSVALTTEFLAYCLAIDPKINAFISYRNTSALAQAQQADEEIARGEYKGMYHGIPLALKDNLYVANEITTMGSKYHQNYSAHEDATVVAKLKAAGAVLIGKLTMHEYAWGITNDNPHYGACRNPWNLEKIPGGSSGGSGAAVAAGLSPASLGTDTAGSIRIPSSACGLVGLKPTHGRVSKFGCFPLAWSLDHIGPMCKTVTDAAGLLQIIAGFDAQDPTTKDVAVDDYLGQLTGDLTDIRIGINEEYFFNNVDEPIELLVREQIRLLEKQGVTVKTVSIPALAHAEYVEYITSLSEASTIHHEQMKRDPRDYGDDIRLLFELGELPSAVDYLQAQQLRRELKSQFTQIFNDVDVLITPTLPILPPDIGSKTVLLNGEEVDLIDHIIRFTGPSNLTGLPALTLPCGLMNGQPVGLQIIGKAFDEATVFNVARAIERNVQFNYSHPVDLLA